MSDGELCNRLRKAQAEADFMECQLDVADLQTVELLSNRKRLGKGESVIDRLCYEDQSSFYDG